MARRMVHSAQSSKLILASASRVRAKLLEAAGLAFAIEAANVDEAQLKQAFIDVNGLQSDGTALATQLAHAKALAVSHVHPTSLIIGADQVLSCEGRLFDKPRDREEAAKNLRMLRGRTHTLHCAIAVARAGEILWQLDDTANLTMRQWSDEFLGTYLDRVGEAVLASVGAYQLEHLGAQLFSEIDGDYFTILGLPLLPLLDFLRKQSILPS